MKTTSGCIGLLLLCLGLSACSLSDRSFAPVRQSVAEQLPQIQLDKVFALSIGRTVLGLAGLVVPAADFDFSALDKVQIAVYDTGIDNQELVLSDFDVETALMQRDSRLSWQTLVKVREEGQYLWIVAGINERKGRVDALSILALERGEMVLVNVNGDLLALLEFALTPMRESRAMGAGSMQTI